MSGAQAAKESLFEAMKETVTAIILRELPVIEERAIVRLRQEMHADIAEAIAVQSLKRGILDDCGHEHR